MCIATLPPIRKRSEPTEENLEMIRSLFACPYHRISESRLVLLYNWIFKEGTFAGPPASREVVDARFQFLQTAWTNAFFHPFESACSASAKIRSSPSLKFLIRLSSSTPGHITLTFRFNEGSQSIYNTRYQINDNGRLVDPKKREFLNIETFAYWFLTHTLARLDKGSVCTKK